MEGEAKGIDAFKEIADITAKKLTGFSIEDPKLVDYVYDDYLRINEKYNMPEIELLSVDPQKYIIKLIAIAESNSIRVCSVPRGENKFEIDGYRLEIKPDSAAAYFIKSNIIAINEEYLEDTADIGVFCMMLKHEIIHGLQWNFDSKNIDMEQREYEAYFGSIPYKFYQDLGFTDDGWVKNSIIANFYSINLSVNNYNEDILKDNLIDKV